jgi:serine/threonine protein kinase
MVVKSIAKMSGRDSNIEAIRSEITNQRAVSHHHHIVRLSAAFESESRAELVQEFCEGGDLFDLIAARGHLNEETSRRFMVQLLSAISCCHENGIAHRDIKPENIMLVRKEASALLDVQLGDFGLSCALAEKQTRVVGSRDYIAPEVLNQAYSHGTCDLWSAGVTMFAMLSGRVPFQPMHSSALWAQPGEMAQAIAAATLPLADLPQATTSVAKDLLCALLCKDPSGRITAADALVHPWFAPVASPRCGIVRPLSDAVPTAPARTSPFHSDQAEEEEAPTSESRSLAAGITVVEILPLPAHATASRGHATKPSMKRKLLELQKAAYGETKRLKSFAANDSADEDATAPSVRATTTV